MGIPLLGILQILAELVGEIIIRPPFLVTKKELGLRRLRNREDDFCEWRGQGSSRTGGVAAT
jgi:hypothetical protein